MEHAKKKSMDVTRVNCIIEAVKTISLISFKLTPQQLNKK